MRSPKGSLNGNHNNVMVLFWGNKSPSIAEILD